MPASVRRTAIQRGVGAATSMPRTTRATYRSQPARSRIGASSRSSTGKPPSVAAGAGSASARAGSVNAAPVACEYSRAMPRTEKQ